MELVVQVALASKCAVNTALAAIAGVLTFEELLDILVSLP